MKKTKHAIERQQQRAISDHVIELVLIRGEQDSRGGYTMTQKVFGEVSAEYKNMIFDAHRQLNASKDLAERRSLSKIISRLKNERRQAEKSVNVRVVVDGDTLLTVMKISGRGEKNIVRKLKNQRIH